MRKAIHLAAVATIALSGCGSKVTTAASDYFRAQQSYSELLDKQVGQPPVITVASPPLFIWDIGWLLQGNNGLGPCPVPVLQSLHVNPLPSGDAEQTFALAAQVPAAITNGIFSANIDAHFDNVVRLDYDDASGQLLSEVDVNAALQDPACKRVLAAAQLGIPITFVKGRILARQRFTWLQKASAGLGAKLTVVPGVEPAEFTVSGGSGPNAPLVLNETTASPHFLILETYAPAIEPSAAVAPSGSRPPHSTPQLVLAPVDTPMRTKIAIQSGHLGGNLPLQR